MTISHDYSLLYGNGLTLAILDKIRQLGKVYPIKTEYLSFNIFLDDFIYAEDHKRIRRDFYKYFTMSKEVKLTHDEVRNFIKPHIPEIQQLGYERWVSKYLFDKKNPISNSAKTYLYFLFNYWYNLINEYILKDRFISDYLFELSKSIKENLYIRNFYTTNFDTILDNVFEPDHLHGIFSLPLGKAEEIILHHYDKSNFEYSYLFGTNGLEKLTRLRGISKITQNKYDLNFFHDEEIKLGNLLIFGLSFGRAEVLPYDFFEEYPEHKNNKFIRSVDGHIIEKLIFFKTKNAVKSITIAYYSNEDLINYKEIFSNCNFSDIISYRKTDEFF